MCHVVTLARICMHASCAMQCIILMLQIYVHATYLLETRVAITELCTEAMLTSVCACVRMCVCITYQQPGLIAGKAITF